MKNMFPNYNIKFTSITFLHMRIHIDQKVKIIVIKSLNYSKNKNYHTKQENNHSIYPLTQTRGSLTSNKKLKWLLKILSHLVVDFFYLQPVLGMRSWRFYDPLHTSYNLLIFHIFNYSYNIFSMPTICYLNCVIIRSYS